MIQAQKTEYQGMEVNGRNNKEHEREMKGGWKENCRKKEGTEKIKPQKTEEAEWTTHGKWMEKGNNTDKASKKEEKTEMFLYFT
jgi:hypothetical protein